MDSKTVAVQKLKGYSWNQGAAFVKAYETFASIPHHPKIATMFVIPLVILIPSNHMAEFGNFLCV